MSDVDISEIINIIKDAFKHFPIYLKMNKMYCLGIITGMFKHYWDTKYIDTYSTLEYYKALQQCLEYFHKHGKDYLQDVTNANIAEILSKEAIEILESLLIQTPEELATNSDYVAGLMSGILNTICNYPEPRAKEVHVLVAESITAHIEKNILTASEIN